MYFFKCYFKIFFKLYDMVRQRVFVVNGLPKNEYGRIHKVITKNYGKATHCSNPNCTRNNAKRFEWALKTGRPYSEDINDYHQLCVSCHRKYDYTDEMRHKNSAHRKGKILHNRERIVARISEDDFQLYSSVTKAAKDNNMRVTSICNCLKGYSKSSNGFIWRYRDNG